MGKDTLIGYYVLGFIFNPTQDTVLLMLKNKPNWMKDKANGIGGKIEFNETPLSGMIRECKEETGLEINDWHYVCAFERASAVVHVWSAKADLDEAKQTTDEQIFQVSIGHLLQMKNVMPNLKWLVPMCLETEFLECPRFKLCEFRR